MPQDGQPSINSDPWNLSILVGLRGDRQFFPKCYCAARFKLRWIRETNHPLNPIRHCPPAPWPNRCLTETVVVVGFGPMVVSFLPAWFIRSKPARQKSRTRSRESKSSRHGQVRRLNPLKPTKLLLAKLFFFQILMLVTS